MKHFKALSIIALSTLLSSILYANDAEDGSIQGWTMIDNNSVSNITDPLDKNNRIFQITGHSVYGKYWKYGTSLEGGTSVSVDVKTDRAFTMWIHVKTNEGTKKVTVFPSYVPKIKLDYQGGVRVASDLSLKDGNWHTISFDLPSLFENAGSNLVVEGIEGISFKGRSIIEVDNIDIGNAKPNPPIVDTTPPTITLVGSERITLHVGDNYTELGAVATDNQDSNVEVKINNDSYLDTTTAGTYVIIYDTTDSAGNSASINRTVLVIDSYSYEKSIANPIQSSNPSRVRAFVMQFPTTGIYHKVETIDTALTNNSGTVSLYRTGSEIETIFFANESPSIIPGRTNVILSVPNSYPYSDYDQLNRQYSYWTTPTGSTSKIIGHTEPNQDVTLLPLQNGLFGDYSWYLNSWIQHTTSDSDGNFSFIVPSYAHNQYFTVSTVSNHHYEYYKALIVDVGANRSYDVGELRASDISPFF